LWLWPPAPLSPVQSLCGAITLLSHYLPPLTFQIQSPYFLLNASPSDLHVRRYPDGRQETQYANGRVRVKASDGTVLVDKVLTSAAAHNDFNSPVRTASATGR